MTMIQFWREALLFLIVINVWTMFRFWQDKQRAQAGERRISEADLLGLAALGGSPGALVARRLFRHKTRKQPFSSRLLSIALVQVAILIAIPLVNARQVRTAG